MDGVTRSPASLATTSDFPSWKKKRINNCYFRPHTEKGTCKLTLLTATQEFVRPTCKPKNAVIVDIGE